MMFLIGLGKGLGAIILICLAVFMLYIVWVVAVEVGWTIRQENRKSLKEKQDCGKYLKEDKRP